MAGRTNHMVAILTTCLLVWSEAEGHGYLTDPLQRGSLFRDRTRFPDVPEDYDDDGLNCGGFGSYHWENKGRCGVCGDNHAISSPRPHEAGGKFGGTLGQRGIIARSYSQGELIRVQITINANHRGYFLFKLCADDNNQGVTQQCLDSNPLQVVSTNGGRQTGMGLKYPLAANRYGNVEVQVQLPQHMTCQQCVLQWTYVAGNNWGCDRPGVCGTGLGRQEIFINCADIAISPSNGHPPPPAGVTSPRTDTFTPKKSTTTRPKKPTTTRPKRPTTTRPKRPTTTRPKRPTITTTTPKPSPRPTTIRLWGMWRCRAVGFFEGSARVNVWCNINCAEGFCPASHCRCV